jgi:hypothetical protein
MVFARFFVMLFPKCEQNHLSFGDVSNEFASCPEEKLILSADTASQGSPLLPWLLQGERNTGLTCMKQMKTQGQERTSDRKNQGKRKTGWETNGKWRNMNPECKKKTRT